MSRPAIDEKPPRPRRRIPVSLGLLAVILGLLGIGGGWRCGIAYRQWVAIGEIEQLGGYVCAEPVGPDWLRKLVGAERMRAFDDVTAVALNNLPVADSMLSQIGRLKRLKALWLRETQVTDAGLVHLNGLSRLECLNVAKTKVTAAGVENLAPHRNLKVLWLDNSQAKDAGLQRLQKSTRLEWLIVDKPGARGSFDDLRILYIKQLEYVWRLGDAASIQDSLSIWESNDLEPRLVVRRIRSLN